MDKKEFFQNIEGIIFDPIFIGKCEEDVQQEIDKNKWSICINKKLTTKLVVKDFMDFFEMVITNRSVELKKLKNSIGMLFYVWFNRQAGKIEIILISDYNPMLAFGWNAVQTDNLEIIFDEFLKSQYHDGIPLEGIENDTLKVYVLKINS